MKLTINDMKKVLGYLDVAKSVTENAIKTSTPGLYQKHMIHQLEDITALIERIEKIEI